MAEAENVNLKESRLNIKISYLFICTWACMYNHVHMELDETCGSLFFLLCEF